MGRWISAEYIKAVMKGDRIMQGNCEYELWKQEVDKKVDAMPSIDIVRCKECKYCVIGRCWKDDGLGKYGNVADDDFCSRGEREGER